MIENKPFMEFGDFKLYSLSDGCFRLDGGAVFGVVPKVMWQKQNPPDENNRVLLGLNPMLICKGNLRIIVDTGIGNKFDNKFKGIYGIDKTTTLHESLEYIGLTEKDISIVINTHLHFDHAGGNTVNSADGGVKPSFPNARYIVQSGEWEDALASNDRTNASYLLEDFIPVMETGQFELIDGNQEIEEGVSVFKTSGHNKHIQLVKIDSKGKSAIYLSDIIPTTTHLQYPYITGYDLYPLETLKIKEEIIEAAVEENWLLIFEHDPQFKMGYVGMEGDKPVFKNINI